MHTRGSFKSHKIWDATEIRAFFEQKNSGVPGFRIVVPSALSASGECYRLLPSLDLGPVTIRTAIERSFVKSIGIPIQIYH